MSYLKASVQNYQAPRVNINIMLKFECFRLLILWALLATALQDFSRLALILCLFHSQSDSWFKSSNVHWETSFRSRAIGI
ncbi:hypothetical protein MJO28_016900 [Puccinia striiformis f. sp. tritici]|uniref:Uncharacterized protein n=1 Tax=Puccinia striiformis TaxID=27350 RepID=A0A2S4UB56_9BASI|nr:hypothetical protein MJO28_016900 [Puccinia striiformis f. sp. tritici]POV94431.1 hypothetical protein PSTT_16875 [Puccinia striiformis]POW00148.1 hypothetical protein PSTT_13311 [Puccinia striiformis]